MTQILIAVNRWPCC